MNLLRLSTALAVATALAVPASALAQTAEADHEQHHPGAQSEAATAGTGAEATAPAGAPDTAAAGGQAAPASPTSAPGMMGSGMMGSGMMDPAMMRMMHERMTAAAGSMASGNAPLIVVVPVSGGSMRGPEGGMMDGSMHGGMMEMMRDAGGSMRTGAGPGGMAADQGFAAGVVTPARHLSVDDVRHFLEHRLEALGNPRLTLGEIAEAGADEISAEIVTADGSLVEQLTVDRHSGAIRPVR